MSTETDLQEAIENCSRDPIHIPGMIQSYGAMIALDAKLSNIAFASINVRDHLGLEAQKLIGRPAASVLNEGLIHQARNLLGHSTIESQREVVGEQVYQTKRYQISIHRKGGRAILEFMPIPESVSSEPSALEKTRALLAEIVCEQDIRKLLESSVERLMVQTGYDRVKAYRFLPDGSGEVVAEARSADMESFLGLRFPATDIPPIARRLYVNTPIRVLCDLHAEESEVIGATDDSDPLDMSLAMLRGTAAVHTQYLKNMGVKSTMTLPIVIEGSLWGLFSLHHSTPQTPDPTMLIGAELSGKMLSVVIQHAVQLRHQSHLTTCTSIADDMIVADKKLSIKTYWENQRLRLTEVLPCDGMAYVVGTQVETIGSAPCAEACLAIQALAQQDDRGLASFDDLPKRLPGMSLNDVAGALVLPLASSPPTSLILFRNLVMRTINWAGYPKKDLTKSENGFQLNPRSSFAQYSETAHELSDEWSNNDLEIGTVLWKSLVQNYTAQEVSENKRRLDLLVSELNHRIRNILALVQSLSSKTLGSATSLEGYASALEERILALAGAHDLLTRANMQGVLLDKLAATELKPYLNREKEIAILSGPAVALNADVAPIFALILHELTSNAVKYGALSVPTGVVTLSWIGTAEGLEIRWVETDGPFVTEPARDGFGRSIIESAIPFEFGGKAELSFDPKGVRATFLIPSGEFEASAAAKAIEVPASSPLGDSYQSNMTSDRCLVVEDNFVIAKEMQRALQNLGFQEVAAVSNVAHALNQLEDGHFDFCLLDINLRGEVSTPVARRLTELGIPFVFASGYGSDGHKMSNDYEVPFLTKPVQTKELRDALTKIGVEAA